MTDPLPTIIDTLAGEAGLRQTPPLDPYTLAVAEKTIRDRALKTSFAGDARLLKLAADDIHKLGETA